MRKGLGWIVEEVLGFVTVGRKKREEKKMRKGLSVIAGIAVLLFAYSASAAVVTDGLVSWWTFDDSDSPGYDFQEANPGTVHNATWVSRADDTNNTAGSASSGALYFDGAGDYVNCGNNASLDITNSVTVEAWVKASSAGGADHRAIIDKDLNYHLGLDTSTISHFFASSTDAENDGVHSYFSSGSYSNQWTHLAGVITPGYAKLYVNATLVYTRTNADFDGPRSSGAIVSIGARNGNERWFTGTIDEVRIYNKALNLGEIEQNYNAIPEPSTLLLLGGGLLGLLAVKRIKRK